MKLELKGFGGKYEVKDIDQSKNIVVGYAGYYGNVDLAGDVLMPESATKSIKENGPMGKDRINYLAYHQMNEEPIGRIIELDSDSKGIMFKAKMAPTRKGRDHMELIKAGILNENSIGYKAIKYDMNAYGGRDLKEIELREISAVNLALNDKAIIMDAKGIIDEVAAKKVLTRYDQMAKLLRKGNISDDMGYVMETEMLKLKSIFEDAITTQPTGEVTEPGTTHQERQGAETSDFMSDIVKHLNL